MSKGRSTHKPLQSSRSSGVLLHLTSLPTPWGIGDVGPAAYAWIDRLAATRQTWWQLLPLNAPDATNSPYSAHTAFGGNAFVISPDLLHRDGLLTRDDMPARVSPRGPVHFGRVRTTKRAMLTAAFMRFQTSGSRAMFTAFETFKSSEAPWLNDFALFIALKEKMPGLLWTDWPRDLKRRKPAALLEATLLLADPIERQKFIQFIFWRQMAALRAHAKQRGVKILGDVPIYVSLDSADVWANPHYFQLDRDRRPVAVSGVPPDIFSNVGQRWDNPLYNWDALRADRFRWWIDRVTFALRQADVIRIDHFRGLQAYWSIPARSKGAKHGRWVKAPGGEMLAALQKSLGGLPLVAEDLGLITPEVLALRDRFGLAGMKILQFAFVGGDQAALPHNHVRNSIVYPANHDNDTCVGWWQNLPRDQRTRARAYAPEIADDPATTMVRLAMGSVADHVIVQLQDVLGLGSKDRMNVPGASSRRLWSWRASEAQLASPRLDRFAELTETYARAPHNVTRTVRK